MKKAFFLALILPIAGCGYFSGTKDAEKALKDKSVLDVLKDASEDNYDPPSDGKLTDAQVQMYLKVKERERDLLQAAQSNLKEQAGKVKAAEEAGSFTAALEGLKALKSLGDLVTLDIRAAQELKYNTAEYQWVKGQILEASLTTYTDKLQTATKEALTANLKTMKEARDKATDEQTRQFYDQQISNLEQTLAESETSEETAERQAVVYNQQLLAKYGDEMKMLENEIQKYKGLEK